MARVYRRAKTLLVILLCSYLTISIYQIFLRIRHERNRSAVPDLYSGKPLCAAGEAVAVRLRKVIDDLIFLRMSIDGNYGDHLMVKRIEDHYNNLQELLREIEFVSGNATKTQREKHSSTQVAAERDPKSEVVCPEVFRGTTYGYPFYHKGFETTNCTKPKTLLSDLVTLIFDDVNVVEQTTEGEKVADDVSYIKHLSDFINNIFNLYSGLKAVFILNKSTHIVNKLKDTYNSPTIEFTQLKNSTRGTILRNTINHVRTPYVLIAPQLTHFTGDIKLERLIRIISSYKLTHFVGGSARNLTGHWQKNCLHTYLKNYTLTHRSGYAKSFSECLVCDYLPGPFLARTKIIKQMRMDINLDYGVYRDLFLRAKSHFSFPANQEGGPIVSCPDVMFHVNEADVEDSDLQEFASKHSVRKIVEVDGRVRWFGCRNGLAYRKGDRCPLRRGFLVPPCCLKNLADAIKFIMTQCGRQNIVCELQEGTLLGAVKLNKVLPWERDADVTFLTRDYKKLTGIRQHFEDRGYIFRDISQPWCCVEDREAGGKIEILADGWSVQLYGQHSMDSEALINKGLHPTKVLFSGQWVNTPRSPGDHIRNRYGYEIYRHAEHWMSTGSDSGWASYDTAEGFGACPRAGFHGCIDQYESDGSLQFDNLF